MNDFVGSVGVHRSSFPLRYSDANALGKLGLSQLMDYLQQTAGDQTESLGFGYREQLTQGAFWVLSRFTIRIDKWPSWPGVVNVDTWARGHKGLLALRDFRLSNNQDEVCGRASSAWVVLKNHRPQKPEPWTSIYHLVAPEPPLEEVPKALPVDENKVEDWAQNLCHRSRRIEAAWEDADMNGHINNRRSVAWCLLAHDPAFLDSHEPASIEINFLAEMFAGREYNLCWSQPLSPKDSTWNYGIFPSDSDKPSLRLRVTWRI